VKGLELSQRFFEEVGFPAIREHLPECVPHMAAGLSGGSQCHGNDDEISRDHGWGPSFMVWLLDEAHQQFAEKLRAIFDDLPKEFLGFRRYCQVEHLDRYLTALVGFESAPDKDMDWLHIPEQHLFEVMHRPIFYDGPGDVTAAFEAFAQYPEDVWLKRLSVCLIWSNEWGIKHLMRAEQRGEYVTAAMYWSRFAMYAMKTVFMLNKKYAPYHKWLHREFLKLPKIADEVGPLIQKGFEQSEGKGKQVESIVEILARHLGEQGFEAAKPGDRSIPAYTSILGNYSKSIRRLIQDPEIRKLKSVTEVVSPPTKPTWMWALPEG
jgi:hypothetical protein